MDEFQWCIGAIFHSDAKKFSQNTLLILLRIHFTMRTQETGTVIPLMLLPEALAEEEVSCSLALKFFRYENFITAVSLKYFHMFVTVHN